MENSVRDLMEQEAKRSLNALANLDPTSDTYHKSVEPIMKLCTTCLNEDDRDIKRGRDREQSKLAEREFEHKADLEIKRHDLQVRELDQKDRHHNDDCAIRVRELDDKTRQIEFTNRFGETELLYKKNHDRNEVIRNVANGAFELLKFGATAALWFGCWAASVTYEEEGIVRSPTAKTLGNNILNIFRPKT